MKNLLILLVENPESTLSENTLSEELSKDISLKLSNYIFELSISEVFPVESKYDFSMAIYNEDDLNQIDISLTNFCKIYKSNEKSIGKFITSIAKQALNYKKIIFLKSNSIGLTEEKLINYFNNLNENNIVFGESDKNSFYLFGFNTNINNELDDLVNINEESIENLSKELHFLIYKLPEVKVVENTKSLISLRESISEKTSLAATIDRLVIGIDRVRHKYKQ